MTERSNEEWLRDLRLPEPHNASAIADLRALLVRRLAAAFHLRGNVENAVTEDAAQDALLNILRKLDAFRGESRFTTWAVRVAVNLSLTELRRKHWQNISLDALGLPDMHFDSEVLASRRDDPERAAMKRSLVESVNRAMSESLTERQRAAMAAVVLHGVPLEEVARRLGTNRNALYKLLHDARKRLRSAILKSGLEAEDVVGILES